MLKLLQVIQSLVASYSFLRPFSLHLRLAINCYSFCILCFWFWKMLLFAYYPKWTVIRLESKRTVSLKWEFGINNSNNYKEEIIKLNDKQVNIFLFSVEGVGAVFLSLFLTVYWLGIRTGVVYHSDPVFRIMLGVFGCLFLIFILVSAVLYLTKLRN